MLGQHFNRYIIICPCLALIAGCGELPATDDKADADIAASSWRFPADEQDDIENQNGSDNDNSDDLDVGSEDEGGGGGGGGDSGGVGIDDGWGGPDEGVTIGDGGVFPVNDNAGVPGDEGPGLADPDPRPKPEGLDLVAALLLEPGPDPDEPLFLAHVVGRNISSYVATDVELHFSCTTGLIVNDPAALEEGCGAVWRQSQLNPAEAIDVVVRLQLSEEWNPENGETIALAAVVSSLEPDIFPPNNIAQKFVGFTQIVEFIPAAQPQPQQRPAGAIGAQDVEVPVAGCGACGAGSGPAAALLMLLWLMRRRRH
ncbi:MAG: hypothetical protein HJJLKODD_01021 [Phycisphaerae bacterium]|nr:hypothetical protein [Phycisphaerae bacterium]